jgi:hypothetical protein
MVSGRQIADENVNTFSLWMASTTDGDLPCYGPAWRSVSQGDWSGRVKARRLCEALVSDSAGYSTRRMLGHCGTVDKDLV